MNLELLESQKRRVIEKFGPWIANNIHIAGDFYTMGKKVEGDEIKLRRVLQIVLDTTKQPLDNLRILDLACLEGLYAIEFARHGARVVGIEGREAHIAKARFVKDILSLKNLDIIQDDVRNLSKKNYGDFDVVLCLGILYHLDAPDVFSFLESIGEVCQDIAIIDTSIALGPTTSHRYKGVTYWGHSIKEHNSTDTTEEKIKRYWASLDNVSSFHLSKSSLYCMLSRVGFTSVYECYIPPEPTKPIDRITLLAIKGGKQKMMNSPLMNEYSIENSPESFTAHKVERMRGKFYQISRLIPEKIRIQMKSRGFLSTLFRPYKPPIK
jgi:SAM-dependent methyltransferase